MITRKWLNRIEKMTRIYLIDTYKTKFCYCGVLFYFTLPFLAVLVTEVGARWYRLVGRTFRPLRLFDASRVGGSVGPEIGLGEAGKREKELPSLCSLSYPT